jgi:hypothetical protein
VVVNAQYRINKKPKIEHVLGTEEWYQKKIQQEHSKTKYHYTLPWDLERSKVIAFLDYKTNQHQKMSRGHRIIEYGDYKLL